MWESWLAGSCLGAYGQPLPPIAGDAPGEPCFRDEMADRNFQPGMEQGAAAARACLPGALQMPFESPLTNISPASGAVYGSVAARGSRVIPSPAFPDPFVPRTVCVGRTPTVWPHARKLARTVKYEVVQPLRAVQSGLGKPVRESGGIWFVGSVEV